MALLQFSISGYRSVQNCRFPVGPLSVFVGKNGVGKTNIYRALNLLCSAVDGTITQKIADEGGLESVLWAGSNRTKPSQTVTLSATLDDFEYAIQIGQAPRGELALEGEPATLAEELFCKTRTGRASLMKRQGANVILRDVEGNDLAFEEVLLPSETALGAFRDIARFPALERVRHDLGVLRFYHHFDTGPGSSLRSGSHAIAAPTLAHDGSNLAAVFATLEFITKNSGIVNEVINDAFPGATLSSTSERGRAHVSLNFPDRARPFTANELSDGALRYLALVGALCGYRLPGMIALNEPESSLHPDLVPPLAALIARAARRTRVWIVTHSELLGDELFRLTGAQPFTVKQRDGATVIVTQREKQPARVR